MAKHTLRESAEELESKARYLESMHRSPRELFDLYQKAGQKRGSLGDYNRAERDNSRAQYYAARSGNAEAQRIINEQISDLRADRDRMLSIFNKATGKSPARRVIASAAIISLVGALVSISMNLTGNVIGGSLDNNNWISIGLFFLGCLFTLFYFKFKDRNTKKKKK